MPFQIQCPECGKLLKVPDEARGKKLRCPACKNPFQLPAETPISKPEPKRAVTPAPARKPQASARDYADAQEIDLDEHHRESVSDAAYADRLLKDWKRTLPEVKSTYQPSGKLPAAAVLWMCLGAGLGAPAGVLAAVLVGGLTGVALALVGVVIL